MKKIVYGLPVGKYLHIVLEGMRESLEHVNNQHCDITGREHCARKCGSTV